MAWSYYWLKYIRKRLDADHGARTPLKSKSSTATVLLTGSLEACITTDPDTNISSIFVRIPEYVRTHLRMDGRWLEVPMPTAWRKGG
jgi:hypothetical protein